MEGSPFKKVIARAQSRASTNWIGYINTLMRYYLNYQPDQLTDAQWAEAFHHLMTLFDEPHED